MTPPSRRASIWLSLTEPRPMRRGPRADRSVQTLSRCSEYCSPARHPGDRRLNHSETRMIIVRRGFARGRCLTLRRLQFGFLHLYNEVNMKAVVVHQYGGPEVLK